MVRIHPRPQPASNTLFSRRKPPRRTIECLLAANGPSHSFAPAPVHRLSDPQKPKAKHQAPAPAVKHEKEECMEFKLGLNMLAAVSSFAFLAAIVLGMF